MSDDGFRRILSHAGRYFVWDLLSVAMSAIGSVLLARYLGPTERGVLAVVASFVGVSTIVSLLGSNVAFRALHPRGRASIASYARTTMMSGGLAFVIAAASLPITVLITTGDSGRWDVVLAGAALAVTNLVSLAVLDACKAAGRLTASSRFDLIGAGFTTLLIALTPGPLRDVAVFLWVYVAGYLVRIAIAALSLRRSFGSPDREERARIRSKGRGYVGYTVGQHIATQSETYFVGIAVGATGAGLYSVASTVAGLLKMPAVALGQILNFESARGALTWRRLAVLVGVGWVGTAVLAGVGLLLSGPLILAVFGHEFEESVPLLQILLIAQVALAPYPLVSRALAGAGDTRAVSITGIVGAVSSVALILTLGFSLGVFAAACASLAVYAFLSISMLVVARRIFSTDTDS